MINRKKFAVLVIILLAFLSNIVSAQYFGRNKVQYESFDFKVLHTENFDIHYYPEENKAVYDAGFMLERWRTRYNRIFGESLKKPQPIILYANHSDFQQTNAISGMLSQGTGGVTEGYINRVVIPLTGINKDNNHVLGHELVHAYQYNIMKQMGKGFRSMQRFPLWFIEGMAEYLSTGRRDPHTAMWMRDAALNDNVPTIDEAANSRKYFPYRFGHSIWNYITSNYGDKVIDKLYRTILNSNFEKGFKKVIGISVDSLSTLWREEVKETYTKQLEGKTKPDELGRKLLGEESRLNLAPVLSPNGRYLAVITSKSLFSLDLYILDANSGRVIRRLTSTNTDAHFDALRFTNSAGTWSPEGEKFAYVVIENGDNKIAVSNVETDKLLKKIEFDEVTSINNLAWSPDGGKLAFTGTSGGVGNLYVYNLNKEELNRVTNDKYSEIMPSWSPLGDKLAFVTDRWGITDTSEYKFGNMRIGILNLKDEQIQTLSVSPNAKHINPHFSPGGGDIFFVADPDGISNLYRYSFDERKFYKITNIATGISGLTELSPAMSVSKNTGDVVVSVFNESKYLIRRIDADSTQGKPFKASAEDYIQTVSLPPANDSNEGIVQNYLITETFGLTDSKNFGSRDYQPSLRLLNVGQTSIGVTVDRFGAGIGGGTNIMFSDMLGNHFLSTAVQANGSFKDVGGLAFYQNRKNRYNWGASAGHIPYLTGRIFTSIDTVSINGQPYLARNKR